MCFHIKRLMLYRINHAIIKINNGPVILDTLQLFPPSGKYK